nr:hypothetical protein [Mycolicibacterium sarraceniae]
MAAGAAATTDPVVSREHDHVPSLVVRFVAFLDGMEVTGDGDVGHIGQSRLRVDTPGERSPVPVIDIVGENLCGAVPVGTDQLRQDDRDHNAEVLDGADVAD